MERRFRQKSPPIFVMKYQFQNRFLTILTIKIDLKKKISSIKNQYSITNMEGDFWRKRRSIGVYIHSMCL